jgi:hypothetical protein
MRTASLVLVVAMIALVVPTGSGSPPDLSKPVAAAAFVEPAQAFLTWVPGPVMPDYYVIYGIVNGTFSNITTVPSDTIQASVASIYPSYAVTAVTNGIESAPTLAVMGEEDCIYVYPTIPPSFSICDVGVGLPVHVGVLIEGMGLP